MVVVDAGRVVELFGLGELLSAPSVAASGWGGRNKVWRFEGSTGVFAVKQVIPELVPGDVATAFGIEQAAHAGGVPSARPVVSVNGRCFEQVGGFAVRCHGWMAGSAKDNEDTTPADAAGMGTVVAQLHALKLPAGDWPAPRRFGRDHWLELARRAPSWRWAALVENHIDRIERAEVFGGRVGEDEPIGSHNDLNAHNVLFGDRRQVLIDWDGAGVTSARYERASVATLWAQRRNGRIEHEVASEFLRAYRAAGGTVRADDPEVLPRWLVGVAWWTERNLQIALAEPSDHHDELACGLITALAAGPELVAQRQQFLKEVLARL